MFRFSRRLGFNNFGIACLLFALLGAARAHQTSSEKVVKADDPEHITDAVMIAEIAVSGNPVECGLFVKPPAVVQPVTPFQAGSDWLQQMTISLVNRTNKTIVFGAISLQFLDAGDCRTQPCRAYTIRLGQVPAINNYSARTGEPLKPDHPERPPLNWEPSQTIVVHVSDSLAEIKDALLSLSPVTEVTRVAVHIGPFFFNDGMRWNLGFYSVPDPERRGQFKHLPDNYFPGNRGHNWPPGYDQ